MHEDTKRAAPQSWGTSTGTFQTKKVGEIDISFAEYFISKSVHLTPDIVEYDPGASKPLYDLIIGKQSLHDICAVLDFKDKTITIDSILLPMRNIVNLQLKPSVTRALRHNTCQAQEPVSTRSDTKRVIAILDAKYDKADLPVIVRDNCSHLQPSHREKLLSLLLKYETLFDGTLGNWKTLNWGKKGGQSCIATRNLFFGAKILAMIRHMFQSCGTFFYIR
jgi:hypothetical protein